MHLREKFIHLLHKSPSTGTVRTRSPFGFSEPFFEGRQAVDPFPKFRKVFLCSKIIVRNDKIVTQTAYETSSPAGANGASQFQAVPAFPHGKGQKSIFFIVTIAVNSEPFLPTISLVHTLPLPGQQALEPVD
jgi:hypothetical protein